MGTVSRIPELDISVSRREIARLLGYGRSGVPARVRSIVDEIDDEAAALLSPACAYRMMKKTEYAQSPYLRELTEIALCLVTVGGALEARVEWYKDSGDLTRAIIMDSYGSAAAEAAADSAEAAIQEEIHRLGLLSSRRFSPGYGTWDVREQEWILPALDGGSLGVTLTENCMMVPRKSITFAIVIGGDEAELRDVNVCEYCGMVRCRFRHTTEKCFEDGNRNDG